MGEGLNPASIKLAPAWEFTDLPRVLVKEKVAAKRETKGRSSREVTDIYTWLQCHSSYILV